MIASLLRVLTSVWCMLIQLQLIQGGLLSGVLDTVGSDVGDLINGIKCDSKTTQMCRMNTSDFILYYNHTPEVHRITNEDGCVLTLVRCKSRKPCPCGRQLTIFQHGILGSSDDAVIYYNGLAFALADECMDVWMPNNRGNYYSREGLGDWNFSWDTIAFEDFPIVFNYILDVTKQKKFYYVAHSQGVSSILALLSECPVWNERILALGLMAPIAFMSNQKLFGLLAKLLRPMANGPPISYEIFPRSGVSKMVGSLCKGLLLDVCLDLVNAIEGQNNHHQADRSMAGVQACIVPSGASICQFQHYAQLMLNQNYGPRLVEPDAVPENFRLDRITAPIYLCYSKDDLFADIADVQRLIPMLSGTTDLCLQEMEGYNHLDFVQSDNANQTIYTNMLRFFAKHTC